MTTYIAYGVTLSDNQRKKLAKAFKEKSPITLRLSHSELTGSDEMMLTKTQIKKIQKARSTGKGVDLKISKTQIAKIAKKGGTLFSSLLNVGTKLLPQAMNIATKILPALATGALSSVGNFATDKILGAGMRSRPPSSGGMIIPHSKIPELLPFGTKLTEKQKRDLAAALQSGKDLKIKPTKKQSGGFLGTLLASIGVPILLRALTGSGVGSGMQNRPLPGGPGTYGRGMQNRPVWFPPNMMDPPVPIIGRGAKRGAKKTKKKKQVKGSGLLLGKDSPFNKIPLLGAIF